MEIKLKKMSKEANILTRIIDELHEIKTHLCNQRDLEGGIALGILIANLYSKLEKSLLNNEHESEKDEEEEKDEFKEDLKEAFKILDESYEEKCEDFEDAMKTITEKNNEIDEKYTVIQKLKEILKDLIKNDHIYPSKLGTVIHNFALACQDETVAKLYALQSGKTISMNQ